MCVVHYAGEVNLIEYGENDILGSVRTNHPTLVLSVRCMKKKDAGGSGRESQFGGYGGNEDEYTKKIAFLLDAQTVCVKDLLTQHTATVNHDCKIDWLELNDRANLLLIRDKRRFLHLYDCTTQERSQLLNFCTYVQWVPNSDVVVAQNRNSLCVWYNIHTPGQVTTHVIKGDVEDIERTDGRTEVIVDGEYRKLYTLDESLIEFGSAIEDRDWVRAVDILDGLEVTNEVDAMWRQLSTAAVAEGDLRVAQRCAAALGNVAMSKFLGDAKEIKFTAEEIWAFVAATII